MIITTDNVNKLFVSKRCKSCNGDGCQLCEKGFVRTPLPAEYHEEARALITDTFNCWMNHSDRSCVLCDARKIQLKLISERVDK